MPRTAAGPLRLALVSPMPPQPSGVAAYAAELAAALSAHYAIDLVCDCAEARAAWAGQGFRVLAPRDFDANAATYDRILYQLGNSNAHRWMFPLLTRAPGAVTLHDVYLSGVLSDMDTSGFQEGAWFEALYADHGWGPASQRFHHPDPFAVIWRYPCCGTAIHGPRSVIVHSEEARSQIRRWYGEAALAKVALIPHLRALPDPRGPADAAGPGLDLPPDAFLVCAFGGLGPTKMNRELLRAFAQSALAADPRCVLAFVGGELGTDHARALAAEAEAEATAMRARVRLTGWLPPARFRAWLRRADLAVQLRARSRGESSGAALDCLANGAPTIVNAHGSMAELPAGAVWRLPDAFAPAQLAEALERLRAEPALRAALAAEGRRAVGAAHAPCLAAARYADAIEAAYARPQATVSAPRRLLVDVSALARQDLRTGVERVARALVRAWTQDPPAGLRVEPVRAEADGFTLARAWTARLLGLPRPPAPDAPSHPRAGDLYLMPDLEHQSVIRNREAYRAMRRDGVRTAFVVHDLLPVTHPQFFPPHAGATHAEWLGVVAEADLAVCPSRAVAAELEAWVRSHAAERVGRLRIAVSHHGADLRAAPASTGVDKAGLRLLGRLSGQRAVLMVGTVEPRKGHADALDAFEILWREGASDILVVAGRPGWMVDALLARLRGHPERGRRLFYVEDASDDLVDLLYAACGCLLMASRAEGFGLPIVEAAARGCGVVARDIPVFRELAGEHAMYFDGDAEALAETLRRWRRLDRRGDAPRARAMQPLTWAQSASNFGRTLTEGL